MRTVRLSLKTAELLLDLTSKEHGEWLLTTLNRLASELRSAIARASRASSVRRTLRKPKEEKRASKKQKTAAIREALWARAGGACECGCGLPVAWATGHLDHYPGRVRRAQSPEWCWFLAPYCHELKGLGSPSSLHWHRLFLQHAEDHDLAEAAAYARSRIEAEALLVQAQAVSK